MQEIITGLKRGQIQLTMAFMAIQRSIAVMLSVGVAVLVAVGVASIAIAYWSVAGLIA